MDDLIRIPETKEHKIDEVPQTLTSALQSLADLREAAMRDLMRIPSQKSEICPTPSLREDFDRFERLTNQNLLADRTRQFWLEQQKDHMDWFSVRGEQQTHQKPIPKTEYTHFKATLGPTTVNQTAVVLPIIIGLGCLFLRSRLPENSSWRSYLLAGGLLVMIRGVQSYFN